MSSERKGPGETSSGTPHLLEEEHKYQEMVEKANDGFAVSQDGVVLFVNQYLSDLYGYSKEEMIGKSFMQFVHPEERERISDLYTKRMRGGTAPPRYEMIGVKKDGTAFWVENNVSMTTFNGRPALITIIRDISARKRLEEERKTLEARYQQSEKLQAIGQLAGGVAHDFNNQLMGIVGFAHLLEHALQDQPDLKSNVESILVAAHRAADLTKQLLAFARKGKYVNERIDIHHVTAEVIGLLKRSIDKRVRIEQRLDAEPPTVLGDPSQLQNAILNLAINARDSMPSGGELIFTTEVIELDEECCGRQNHEIAPGRYLKLSVTDSGVGMDEETQKRIFEPFFTTKEHGEGTGMGLASVYGTVMNHRGTVQVSSTVGRGTTFSLCLPLLEDAIEDETEKVSSVETRSIPRNGHVFLVDDEKVVCDVTGRMIRSLGYKVTTCLDAREAVEIYRSNHASIDIVIIDMMMPQMDGGELFRAFKEINPDITALLASGYSLNGAAQQILDDGVKGFIQKPFGMQVLASRLAEFLSEESPTEDPK